MATSVALAGDGPTEALELRYHAERAIAQERAGGHEETAAAMQAALPDLLQEYLITRDTTVAMDAVDTAFVQEQFKVAYAMEEPGVALALDVFSGPGTGYENQLRSGIANLADYHSDHLGTVSEKALQAHERMMERQLDRVHHDLAAAAAAFERFDATFDAKVDSRLDSSDHFRTERKVEAVVEKVAEAVPQKAEEKINGIPSKAEDKKPDEPAGKPAEVGKKK